jgi:hypothetical protein
VARMRLGDGGRAGVQVFLGLILWGATHGGLLPAAALDTRRFWGETGVWNARTNRSGLEFLRSGDQGSSTEGVASCGAFLKGDSICQTLIRPCLKQLLLRNLL